MKADERRNAILNFLQKQSTPLSASVLAEKCGVSRQIIVGDIALLRASGVPISATPRGYILQQEVPLPKTAHTIACRHIQQDLQKELYAIVDAGCAVLDVTVEHPVYGQIVGELQIFSRFDADLFIKKLEANNAFPLCNLTDGVHLHTISCPSEENYQQALLMLRKQGILVEE